MGLPIAPFPQGSNSCLTWNGEIRSTVSVFSPEQLQTMQNPHLRKVCSFRGSLRRDSEEQVFLWGEHQRCLTNALREIQVHIADRLLSTVVKTISFGARLLAFETWFYHILVLWVSVYLSFLIHKIGIILPNLDSCLNN